MEVDGLRCSSEELMCRKTQLASEVDVLQRHMSVLSGQNRQLGIELDGFVATDHEV